MVNIDHLKLEFKRAIKEGDKVAVCFLHDLGSERKEENFSMLCDVLISDTNWKYKNAAAVGLRDYGDDRAIPILFQAINDPGNKDRNGTFVYALQTLDCRGVIVELADLICNGDYEVSEMALQAIETLKSPIPADVRGKACALLNAKLATVNSEGWQRDHPRDALTYLETLHVQQ